MMRLEDVLKTDEEEEERIRRLTRYHGIDPLNVILEKEKKLETKKSLMILLKELKPLQREILLMTTQGYSIRRIASELNRSHATIAGCKRTIMKRLFGLADEARIKELREQITKAITKGKSGRRYEKQKEEYAKRYEVRAALKKIYVSLMPLPESSKVRKKSCRPTCLFERMMGKKKECRLPRYFVESFGDERTVCSLCECRCGNKKSLE